MKLRFLLVCVLMFVPLVPIHAQLGDFTSSTVTITTNPENPEPNTTVTATLSGYSFDLDSSNITWYVNGVEKGSGGGKKDLNVDIGAMGTQTKISVVIITAEGQRVTTSTTVAPSSVDLIWQAYTYTPPLYKGKALFSHQSAIRIVAIPHIMENGREVPAQDLIYKWTMDDTVLGDVSGYGKSTLALTGSIISRPVDIIVSVSTKNGITGVGYTTITPVVPEIHFYKKDHLYGVQYQHDLGGNISLTDPEIEIVAEPYFFSGDKNSSNLSYSWNMNGTDIGGGASKVFRTLENKAGTSNVTLSISYINKILQTATENLNIYFRPKNSY